MANTWGHIIAHCKLCTSLHYCIMHSALQHSTLHHSTLQHTALLISHCLQCTVYSTLLTVHRLQYTAYSTLITLHCLQYTTYSTLLAVHCLQFTAYTALLHSAEQTLARWQLMTGSPGQLVKDDIMLDRAVQWNKMRSSSLVNLQWMQVNNVWEVLSSLARSSEIQFLTNYPLFTLSKIQFYISLF